MTTVRQLERLWSNQSYQRLTVELLGSRPEGQAGCLGEDSAELGWNGSIVAAALAVIRLDELNQSHTPLFTKLIRRILEAQETDGGWGDVMTTALCIRALCASRGQGSAVDRGIVYLARLQQPGGIWPRVPIRRMPSDAAVSAFVLLQLGNEPRFARAVRIHDANAWFEHNAAELDKDARLLWQHARPRCRNALHQRPGDSALFLS